MSTSEHNKRKYTFLANHYRAEHMALIMSGHATYGDLEEIGALANMYDDLCKGYGP